MIFVHCHFNMEIYRNKINRMAYMNNGEFRWKGYNHPPTLTVCDVLPHWVAFNGSLWLGVLAGSTIYKYEQLCEMHNKPIYPISGQPYFSYNELPRPNRWLWDECGDHRPTFQPYKSWWLIYVSSNCSSIIMNWPLFGTWPSDYLPAFGILSNI